MSIASFQFPSIIWKGNCLPFQMVMDVASPFAEYPHVDSTPAADTNDIRQTLAGGAPANDAFRRIIQRHQSPLARRMRRFARGSAAVEELVQDIFVEVFLSLPTYSQKIPFQHWLNKIATRVGYRSWKKNQRMRINSFPDDFPAAEFSSNVDTEKLHILMAQLPPRDRLVLTLLHLEDRTVAETAEFCGWTKTMVKVQAFRARAKLKKLLTQKVPP